MISLRVSASFSLRYSASKNFLTQSTAEGGRRGTQSFYAKE